MAAIILNNRRGLEICVVKCEVILPINPIQSNAPQLPVRNTLIAALGIYAIKTRDVFYRPCVTTYSPATRALSILATTAGISRFNLPRPSTALRNPFSTPSCLSSGWTSKSTSAASAIICCFRASSISSSRFKLSRNCSACASAVVVGTERFNAATSSRSFSSCVIKSATRRRLRVSKGS